MILSHKHKFLFLKTHKTAGTSIEIFLSQFCGPADIITEVSPEDERLRRRLGYPGPQNHLASEGRLRFRAHVTLAQVLEKLKAQGESIEFLSDYFKFCFERNPFDKLVSSYFFQRSRAARGLSFQEFLARGRYRRLADWNIWSLAGRQAVDFIGRFEDLEADLALALERIGIEAQVELPKAKTRYRSDRQPYMKWYPTPESRRYVEELFARELAHLGYCF
ncbi:MAG: sulfotransferase family 2 domain-containing protein [Vulcanimicrobiota bacterium]